MPSWRKVITSGSDAALNSVLASTATVNGSGSTLLDVLGSQGQLFSVTDSLTGTLMSVNDISGLPILEVFDADKVVMGAYGANTLIVTGSKVGVGTASPTYKLDISGSLRSTGPLTVRGDNLTNVNDYNSPSAASVNIGTYYDAWGFIDIASTNGSGGWLDFSKANGSDYGGRIRYDNSSDRFDFYTAGGGTPGLSLDSSGRLGVGLTNPSYPFTVKNSAGATVNIGGGNSNTVPAIAIQSESGSWSSSTNGFAFYYNATDGDLDLYRKSNSATEAHVMTWERSTGYIGIGTTNPDAHLEVNGTVFIPAANSIYMGGTAGTATTWGSRQSTTSGVHTLSAGAFKVDNSGYVSPVTASLYVNTLTANVGIGTTSPSRPLHVAGGIIRVQSGTSSATGQIDFGNADTYFGYYNSVFQARVWDGFDYYEAFRIDGANHNLILSTSEGNVGIGTTSPGAKLQVTSTNQYEQIRVVDDGAYYGRIGYEQANATIFGLYNTYTGTGSRIDLGFGASTIASTTPVLSALVSGNVGIGTTSPAQKLDVRGGYFMTNDGAGKESAFVQGGTGYAYFGNLNAGPAAFGNSENWTTIVADGGNVGIGTTSPTSKLHVVGDTQLTGVTTFTEAGTGSGTRLILSGASQYYNFFVGKQYNVSDTFEITPSTAAGGTTFSTPALVIKNSGNVGIGTTAPGSALDIAGKFTFSTTSNLFQITNSTNTGGINLSGNNSRIYFGGYRAIEGTQNGTNLVLGEGYSNVAVHSNATLVVNGSQNVAGNLTVGGSITAQEFKTEYITQTVIFESGSTKFGNTSDDVHQFTGSLEVLGGVTGSFKGNLAGNATSATTAGSATSATNVVNLDGARWNPTTNILLGQTANNQEWSFDITRNGYTGGYWQVWDSSNSTLLKVDAVNGKVSAPYGFVGDLAGTATTASYATYAVSAGSATSATDSDTLDSYHASAFPRKAEDATISGNYNFAGTGVILPSHFYTNRYDANGNVYFHVGTADSVANILNLRVYDAANSVTTFILNGGTGAISWGGNTIWTAGNDGASSGLDADLLDGQHGSYYTNASNISAGTLNNSRLPSAIDVTSVTGSFKGNLAGNATTATSAGSATDATNALNITVADTDTNATYYPMLAGGTSGNVRAYVDASTFTYNASSDTLTLTTVAANLSGNASTATTASYAATAPYSGLRGTVPTWNQNTTGNAATATAVTGKSSISKTAHTAGADDYHLEVYAPNSGDSSKEVSIRFHQGSQYYAQLRYRAGGFRFTGGADDNLTAVYASTFNGALSGNATTATTAGSATDATNALNIAVSDTDTNATYYPMLAGGTSGNIRAYVDASTFTYNASSDTLTVGILEASEKSFNIPHPTQPGKRLIYGVLEGPEHAVYVRGKINGEVIELPEEWTGLVDEDSITVQLTSIGHKQNLYVSDIKDNKVYIKNGLTGTISAFYFIQGTRKDVEPLKIVRD